MRPSCLSSLTRLPIVPAGLLCLIALTGCAEPVPEKTPPRHLIWISLDTTRADHFGFMGNDTVRTPRLDALAAESVVLEDHMSVAPTTLASHTSMMTGKYPLSP